MSERQETIDDIIAEARDKYTVHECNQCAWRKCCSEGFGSEKCGEFRESIWLKLGIEDGYFTQLLDRLEAAHKRERGDCAKLREALDAAEVGLVRWQTGSMRRDMHRELVATIKTALAAPPRNCDIGTAEEQAERYGRHCDKFTSDGMHCETCPCCGKIPFGECEFAWAQMPYIDKEGDAK